MPQPSISYACGRIGVLRSAALHGAQLERLMAAHTYEEARRTLADIGFASNEEMDFQLAAEMRVKKACELVEAVTPEPELTDCFVLLKSRFLAQKPEYLSTCGSIKVELLKHAVTERRYNALHPILKAALDALEKRQAKEFDPMQIDADLDRAMYLMIFDKLKRVNVKAVKRYFTTKVDLQNYIIALRLKAMGKGADFLNKLFLPGGVIALEKFQKAYEEPDQLAKLIKPYGDKLYHAAVLCASDAGKLPLMERTVDDALFGLFGNTKYQTASIEVLISYLLSAQREATDVRLVMAGKLNGFQQAELEERVRELHG
ncbi:MAG: V-type ATPase subunit [Clostridia bacterium]